MKIKFNYLNGNEVGGVLRIYEGQSEDAGEFITK